MSNKTLAERVAALHAGTHWCINADQQPEVFEPGTKWWPCPTLALLHAPEPDARAECECWPTPESEHYVYYGATEPGSAMEQNPDCPVHPAAPAVAEGMD